MGGRLSSMLSTNNDWYVYKRLKKNDDYSPEPEQVWRNISKETALNRFKHEIMAYSLKKYGYENTKSIYLYINSKRVMRVENINNQIVIESRKYLQEYIESQEELAPSRYPLQSEEFYKSYCKNYARIDVYKIAYILNDPPQEKISSYEEAEEETEE